MPNEILFYFYFLFRNGRARDHTQYKLIWTSRNSDLSITITRMFFRSCLPFTFTCETFSHFTHTNRQTYESNRHLIFLSSVCIHTNNNTIIVFVPIHSYIHTFTHSKVIAHIGKVIAMNNSRIAVSKYTRCTYKILMRITNKWRKEKCWTLLVLTSLQLSESFVGRWSLFDVRCSISDVRCVFI